MRSVLTVFLLIFSACSCDEDPMLDGGPDVASDLPIEAAAPLTFEAVPDPDVLTECQTAPPAEGTVRAKVVSCDDELLSGSVAMGAPGDFLIENAVARFIIRGGEESATTLGAYSGGVLDAAPQGGVDLIKEVFMSIDLSAARPTKIAVVNAGADGVARVRVLFDLATVGLVAAAIPALGAPVRARGVIEYELRPGEPTLRITVGYTTELGLRSAGGQPGMLAFIGGGAELVQPEVGFLPENPGEPGPAIVLGEGESSAFALRLFTQSGAASNIGTLNWLTSFARAAFLQGELFEVSGLVSVGETAADAYNGVLLDEPDLVDLTLTGTDRAEVRIGDRPLLRTRVDGSSVVKVVPGEYGVLPGFTSFFEGTPTTVAAAGAPVSLVPAPRGILQISVGANADTETPVRVLVDQGDTELLRFVARGDTTRELPPGAYRVTVSHGMEYDAIFQDVVIAAAETVMVEGDLTRIVDTTGYVAGDFHLHSEMSPDSTHATIDALNIVAAEGLEIVASTDHDFLNDYPRFVEEAGLSERLMAVVGVEGSATTYAHVGGYPVRRDPTKAGAGAPVWFDMTPPELFDSIRALGNEEMGPSIVQLNHPRRGQAHFEFIDFDRETLTARKAPEELGFPADTDLSALNVTVIEVWNATPSEGNEEVFLDYLALVAGGRDFAMIANSDSHAPQRPAGVSRNYIEVPDDSPGNFTWRDVGESIIARRVTCSVGMFVTAVIDGPAVGGMLPVRVRVQAPPWVTMSGLRVYAGREVVLEQTVEDLAPEAIRFEGVLMVPAADADFVIVRADGTADSRVLGTSTAMGVTNPLMIP